MRDLMNQVPVSDRLDRLVADSLNQLRAEQKQKRTGGVSGDDHS